MRRNQATAAINGVCNNGDRFLLSLLVCFTTEKTGDLPTGGLLHIAHLLTANGQHRVERHETDFATGREHLDDRQHRVCRRIVRDDAHQIQAECLDDGCVPVDRRSVPRHRRGSEIPSRLRRSGSRRRARLRLLRRSSPPPANKQGRCAAGRPRHSPPPHRRKSYPTPHHRAHRGSRPSQRFRWRGAACPQDRSFQGSRRSWLRPARQVRRGPSFAISASSLRKASKLGSLAVFGRVIGTGLYGPRAAEGGCGPGVAGTGVWEGASVWAKTKFRSTAPIIATVTMKLKQRRECCIAFSPAFVTKSIGATRADTIPYRRSDKQRARP